MYSGRGSHAAKQDPHRPGIPQALGLRAGAVTSDCIADHLFVPLSGRLLFESRGFPRGERSVTGGITLLKGDTHVEASCDSWTSAEASAPAAASRKNAKPVLPLDLQRARHETPPAHCHPAWD